MGGMEPYYRLHLSSRLDRFPEELPDLFYPEGIFGVLPHCVVQNLNVAEWLKIRLAQLQGVAVDRGILLPEQAIRRYIGQFPDAVPDGRRLLFMDSLKIAVYRELRTLLEGSDPDFDSLRRYRDADPEGRMYDLSDMIAGLFYGYSMNCPALVAGWETPGAPFPGDQDTEKWQRKLWDLLFRGDAGWILSGQAMERIVRQELVRQGDPERVVLYGSSFLGETALRFFHYLSHFLPVDHCLFYPGQDGKWGGLGRDLLALLHSFKGIEILPFNGEMRAEKGSLRAIQQGLISGERATGLSADRSFRALSCAGDVRQVETARDRILEALSLDPTLKLTDIGVMAPDINRFSLLIGSIFPPVLPCNFIDLSGGEGTPYVSAVLHLIQLSTSDFTRADLYPLVGNPCFLFNSSFTGSERAEWARALDLLAVYEGFGEEPWTWDSAFGRQAEYLLSGEPDPPLDLFDDGLGLTLIRMTSLIRELYNELESLKRLRLSLPDWVSRTLALLEKWIVLRPGNHDDENDARTLQRALRNILNAAAETGRDEPDLYTFGFWRRLFRETVRKSRGSRGRYLTGGITCSSLKPLRAVPFRMIVILGLEEAAFPLYVRPLSLDLSAQIGKALDPAGETGDLYGFFETVTACGETLILLHNGRDPRRGTPVFPSPVVSDLLKMFQGKRVSEPVPLQPYDPSLFVREAPLAGFSVRHYREACRTLTVGSVTCQQSSVPWKMLPEVDRDILSVSELYRFLKDPPGLFFRKRFSLYPEVLDEETLFAGSGQEPMAGSPREAIPLLEEWVFDSGFSSQAVEQSLHVMERRGRLQSGYRELVRNDLEGVAAEVQGQLSALDPWSGPFVGCAEDSSVSVRGKLGPVYRDGKGRPVIPLFFPKGAVSSSRMLRAWLQGFLLRLTGAGGVIAPDESFVLLKVTNCAEREYGKPGKEYPVKISESVIPADNDREILDRLLALYDRGLCEPLPLLPDVFSKLKCGPETPGKELVLAAEAGWPDWLEDEHTGSRLRYSQAVRYHARWLRGFIGLEEEMALLNSIYGRFL